MNCPCCTQNWSKPVLHKMSYCHVLRLFTFSMSRNQRPIFCIIYYSLDIALWLWQSCNIYLLFSHHILTYLLMNTHRLCVFCFPIHYTRSQCRVVGTSSVNLWNLYLIIFSMFPFIDAELCRSKFPIVLPTNINAHTVFSKQNCAVKWTKAMSSFVILRINMFGREITNKRTNVRNTILICTRRHCIISSIKTTYVTGDFTLIFTLFRSGKRTLFTLFDYFSGSKSRTFPIQLFAQYLTHWLQYKA